MRHIFSQIPRFDISLAISLGIAIVAIIAARSIME